jgi:hypothetical protein
MLGIDEEHADDPRRAQGKEIGAVSSKGAR